MRDQRRRGGVFGRRRSGNGEAPVGEQAGEPVAVPLEPLDALEAEFARPPKLEKPSPAVPLRPRIAGPLEAFLRHPFLTLIPLLLLVAGAVLLGVERDAEYKSASRIAVGNTEVNPFLLERVVAGNQAIAASYARAIEARPVAENAARAVGISPEQAADRLQASQVPGSTLIQVEATGPSSGAAVELANAGARSLIDYIERVNRTDEAEDLFKQYQKAQAKARRAERRVQALLRSSQRNSERVTRARIAQDTAQLRATDLANRYRAASIEAAAASRLTLLAPAVDADSDRREVFEQLLVAAAAGGLVLGFALALLRTNWRLLRTLRGG